MDLKDFELGQEIIEKHNDEQASIQEARRLAAERREAEKEAQRQEEPAKLLARLLETPLEKSDDGDTATQENPSYIDFVRRFELLAPTAEDEADPVYVSTLVVKGRYYMPTSSSVMRSREALEHGCRLSLEVRREGTEPTEHPLTEIVAAPRNVNLPPENMGFSDNGEDTPAQMRVAYQAIREAAEVCGHDVLTLPEGYDPAAGYIALREHAEDPSPQSV